MPEIKNIEQKEVWAVEVIECERGWGCKVDEVRYFDNKADEDKFAKAFNSANTDEVAPDWYMQAQTPVKTTIAAIFEVGG